MLWVWPKKKKKKKKKLTPTIINPTYVVTILTTSSLTRPKTLLLLSLHFGLKRSLRGKALSRSHPAGMSGPHMRDFIYFIP